MNTDSIKRRAPAIVLPASACLLAGVAGWLTTGLPISPSNTDATAQWRLPTTSSADAAEASKALAARSMWGAAAPPPGTPAGASRPLTPPDWRIIATAVAGNDRTALIRVGTEPAYELHIGDTLPGGAVVRGIEVDRLIVELHGKRRALKLPAP